MDSTQGGYGSEAINTIVQEMENHKDDTIVIFAGYEEEMKQFIDQNPGLSSRIPFHLHFEDYTDDQLLEIAHLHARNSDLNISLAEDFEKPDQGGSEEKTIIGFHI